MVVAKPERMMRELSPNRSAVDLTLARISSVLSCKSTAREGKVMHNGEVHQILQLFPRWQLCRPENKIKLNLPGVHIWCRRSCTR